MFQASNFAPAIRMKWQTRYFMPLLYVDFIVIFISPFREWRNENHDEINIELVLIQAIIWNNDG